MRRGKNGLRCLANGREGVEGKIGGGGGAVDYRKELGHDKKAKRTPLREHTPRRNRFLQS